METAQPPSFVFFHYGRLPKYLRFAIESVRSSNPEAGIILVSEHTPDWKDEYQVECRNFASLPSDKLEQFKKSYRHISVFDEFYERFVLERWYMLETLRQELGGRTLFLVDSDVMVFGDVGPFLAQLGDKHLYCCGWSPHFSVIQGPLDGFLDHILSRYTDEEYLANAQRLHDEARKKKQLKTLGEMQLFYEYISSGQDGQQYDKISCAGYLDINIHVPDGFVSAKAGRRTVKCVRWEQQDGRLVPTLKREDSGEVIPALMLHFQGPAKKRMRSFNPWPRPTTPPSWFAAWRNRRQIPSW
ncbi:MAG: hypothetical protein ACQKBW_02880 [Puniceicoccales bacterium]